MVNLKNRFCQTNLVNMKNVSKLEFFKFTDKTFVNRYKGSYKPGSIDTVAQSNSSTKDTYSS